MYIVAYTHLCIIRKYLFYVLHSTVAMWVLLNDRSCQKAITYVGLKSPTAGLRYKLVLHGTLLYTLYSFESYNKH